MCFNCRLDLLNDGQTLASGSTDKITKYWNLTTKQCLKSTNTSYNIMSLAVIKFFNQ